MSTAKVLNLGTHDPFEKLQSRMSFIFLELAASCCQLHHNLNHDLVSWPQKRLIRLKISFPEIWTIQLWIHVTVRPMGQM